MIGFAIATMIAWGVLGVAYQIGLATQLGAHPFWSDQVLLVGAIAGPVVALAARRFPFGRRLSGLSLLAAFSATTAIFGKNRFAASYAEDTFSGQLWYFGWFGICIFGVAVIITGYQRR